MSAKSPTDSTVFVWIITNYRIMMVVITLVICAVMAWANMEQRVDENYQHIERVEAQMTTNVDGINKALAVQDTKLDGIGTDVTRLLVISEREDRGH